MLISFLIIIGIVLVGFAVVTQYSKTDTTQSVPARVWAAVVLGFTAIGAAISAFLTSGATP